MQVARPRPESHISGVLPKPRFAIDRGSELALPLSTLESCLQSKQRTTGLHHHVLEVPTLSNVSVCRTSSCLICAYHRGNPTVGLDLNDFRVRKSLLGSDWSSETDPGSPFTPKTSLGSRIVIRTGKTYLGKDDSRSMPIAPRDSAVPDTNPPNASNFGSALITNRAAW